MSEKPIVMNGIIQRTDDIGMLKQQQDNRPMVEQHNLQAKVEQREDHLRHQVMTSENSAKADTHADAREQGKNAYLIRKKEHKKKEAAAAARDRVVKKNSSSGFDMKV